MVDARRESGHALVLALVVLLLTSIALSLIASALRLQMQSLQREARELKLVALSDAVLAETLAHLGQERSFRGVEEYSFGGGLISSRVEPLSRTRAVVAATATVGGKVRTVQAEVVFTALGPQIVGWQRLQRSRSSG